MLQKRKKRNFIIVTIIVLFVILLNVFVNILIHFNKAKISYTKIPFNYVKGQIAIGNSPKCFIMDSGAPYSHFYKNDYMKYFVAFSWAYDTHRKGKIVPFFFFPQIECYKSQFFLSDIIGKYDVLEVSPQNNSFVAGILGMDVIGSANWHFDLSNCTMESLPLDSVIKIPSNALEWTYIDNKTPEVDLNVCGLQCKALIDFGCNVDLCLDSLQIVEICKQNKPYSTLIDTTFGLFSWDLSKCYYFDSLKIGNIYYDDIHISKYKYCNLVGLRFLRHFDFLFWDSKHKKVYMWNKEK
ncbi:MAG: hypothetical protein J5606_01175 [Bacteroidales bacterium]|nr:hypothetical protein [Bacteroidales bacterium]